MRTTGTARALIAAGVVLAAACRAAGEAPKISHYGASFGRHDDLTLAGLDIVVRTEAFAGTGWLALDLSAPLEVYHFRDDGGIDLAADWGIGLGVMMPLVGVGLYCESCEPVARTIGLALLPLWLPLVHPALIAEPADGVGLALGYDAAYVFQSEDKGVICNPYLGLRVEPFDAVRLEGGINHQNFWNWERGSESFGWGWYVRLALSTDLVGGAEPSGGYD
jgi:hypothetical protein